jgi:hypothetical protein
LKNHCCFFRQKIWGSDITRIITEDHHSLCHNILGLLSCVLIFYIPKIIFHK